MRVLAISLTLLCGTSFAWVPSASSSPSSSRADFLKQIVSGSAAAVALSTATSTGFSLPAFAADKVTTLENGVSYIVKKEGNGQSPEKGDLIAIRFAAYAGDQKIDDIFDTPEPYYTRVGSGGLLKGVEQTLPLMKLGDRWELTIPSELAFGQKGRPASAGKPRIPAGTVVTFDVEVVGLPGKEVELIDLIGDD